MKTFKTVSLKWNIRPLKVLVCLSLLAIFSEALPGNYITMPDISERRLPFPIITYATSDTDMCKKFCVKNSVCEAFSISAFEKTCHLHKLVVGTRPVLHLGFQIYVKGRAQSDGYNVYKTDYIKLILEKKNFYNAKSHCGKLKGDLVKIKDEGLNNLIVQIMTKHVVFRAYIGLTDAAKEEEWKYLDGTTPSYTNWEYYGYWERYDRNCAFIDISGMWFQKNCRDVNYFICQIPIF